MAALDVTALVYHTHTGATVLRYPGEAYTAADAATFDTLRGLGFVWPTDYFTSAKATGATSGAPGVWTPANTTPPGRFTQMAGAITASPATAWTTGKYVGLGDGSKAYWNGTAWVAGTAP